MRKVDTATWGEFTIGELFFIKKGTRLTKADMREGEICFIGASAINNGITARISNSERIHPAGTITMTYNGSVGEAFYQDEEFWASDDVNVLYPKFPMSWHVAMFIIPILKKAGLKYAFIDKWKKEDMERDMIKLPVDQTGNPDFLYMETYMKNLEIAVSTSLTALRSAKCSAVQRGFNISAWGTFLVQDLFEIHPTKAYTLTNKYLFEEGGTNPVIVNSSFNNGIGGYTNKPLTEEGGIITFSDTTTATTIFYQDKPFVGYPHVQGLYPIGEHKNSWNRHSLMFFLSVFRERAQNQNVDYVNKFTREMAGAMQVKLPIDEDGSPNFSYMESFMARLEMETEQFLMALRHTV